MTIEMGKKIREVFQLPDFRIKSMERDGAKGLYSFVDSVLEVAVSSKKHLKVERRFGDGALSVVTAIDLQYYLSLMKMKVASGGAASFSIAANYNVGTLANGFPERIHLSRRFPDSISSSSMILRLAPDGSSVKKGPCSSFARSISVSILKRPPGHGRLALVFSGPQVSQQFSVIGNEVTLLVPRAPSYNKGWDMLSGLQKAMRSLRFVRSSGSANLPTFSASAFKGRVGMLALVSFGALQMMDA